MWVLEDQLSTSLGSLVQAPPDAPVLLIESDRAFRRVPYHKKRITFLISAMRHFALELESAGRTVCHYPFVAQKYRDSLSAFRHHVQTTGSTELWVVEPSEHDCRVWIDSLPEKLGVTVRYFPNTLFLTQRDNFKDYATNLKSPVMEFFYRRMRTKHNVLMQPDGKTPVGGTWNFDKQNRKGPPVKTPVPALPSFPPDDITRDVMTEIQRRFPDHPGDVTDFDLPVTRAGAQHALNDFVEHRLPHFGTYEDAMVTGQPVLFHSFLSPLINAGLLDPMTCIRAAEQQYHQQHAPLNAVEGFVRQILGWREFVYGIYWAFMPEYRTRNTRNSTRELPAFLWSGDTDLNCLKQTVGNLLDHAYTHHIQRLMILCNFATLTGLSPQAMNDWFLAMYVDSHDWVVTPNVIGMGMNADHGTIATKPYVSSAAYINRMSDYCKNCKYNPKLRTGENACPFNYLYWTFMQHYRQSFSSNPRMSMMMKNVDRIDADEMKQMMQERKGFIEQM